MPKRLKIEDHHCEAFTNWLELSRLKFTHIANEDPALNRLQAIISAKRARKIGLRKGIPDFVVLTPKGTIWVEMKDPAKKPKKGDVMEGWKVGQKERGGLKREQYEWIVAINQTKGAQAKVCYGYEEAKEFVQHFI